MTDAQVNQDVPPAALFAAHFHAQRQRYEDALAACGFDALVIAAGHPQVHYQDDIEASWKPNPHFRLFTPLAPGAGSSIVFRPGHSPVLLHYRPLDFWHLPPPQAIGAWTAQFEIREFGDRDALLKTRKQLIEGRRTALLDPEGEPAPAELIARLAFGRARKTPYEIACMRAANALAAKGHRAARDAFDAGVSELDIHLAYLAASGQVDADLPYGNIVALNEHGAVLHYQYRDRQLPKAGPHTFLIDAGATSAGYAADVTRTYAKAPGRFADLVVAMHTVQQELVARIRPGLDFVDLHRRAHLGVGRVLCEAGLAEGDAETLLETGVTHAFLPHGLGHLIGVQTHDVGGQQVDPEGTLRPPPAEFPALRLTRVLEEDFVVTIEPGLYFIPMLLESLRATPAARQVDWAAVEALLPCGGIRIEDDVRVTASGVENLTRPALAVEGVE